MKFNWRYANYTVAYKTQQAQPRYALGTGIFCWQTPTGQVDGNITSNAFPNDAGDSTAYGMPYRVYESNPLPDSYSTTLHRSSYSTLNTLYKDSYIYGAWHPRNYNNQYSYWVPYHILRFIIPFNHPVTYEKIDPPDGFDYAYQVIVEGVFQGEQTVNPRIQYPQPAYAPYTP